MNSRSPNRLAHRLRDPFASAVEVCPGIAFELLQTLQGTGDIVVIGAVEAGQFLPTNRHGDGGGVVGTSRVAGDGGGAAAVA